MALSVSPVLVFNCAPQDAAARFPRVEVWARNEVVAQAWVGALSAAAVDEPVRVSARPVRVVAGQPDALERASARARVAARWHAEPALVLLPVRADAAWPVRSAVKVPEWERTSVPQVAAVRVFPALVVRVALRSDVSVPCASDSRVFRLLVPRDDSARPVAALRRRPADRTLRNAPILSC